MGCFPDPGPCIRAGLLLLALLLTTTLAGPVSSWQHYWTGQLHSGPGWVTIPAPLHHIPLFLREGFSLKLPAPQDLGTLGEGAQVIQTGPWR